MKRHCSASILRPLPCKMSYVDELSARLNWSLWYANGMFVIILTVVFNFIFVPQYLLPWPLGHHAVFTLAMLRTSGTVSQPHIVRHYFTMLAIYASFAHHTLITSNSITCRTAFYRLFWTKSFWRYRDLLWYRWFYVHKFRVERLLNHHDFTVPHSSF